MPMKKVFRRYVSNIISFANSRIRNSHRDRSDEFYAGEVTPELEESMRNVWQPLIGLDHEILVLHIRKPKNASSLGISLQGVSEIREPVLPSATDTMEPTTGIPNGSTNPPEHLLPVESRHFVHSVMPDGPIGKLNIVRPGDELLQVNGRRLRGTSHTSTVRCLRNLPNHIELVLSRAKSNPLVVDQLDSFPAIVANEPTLDVHASEVGSIDTIMSIDRDDPVEAGRHVQKSASLSPDTAQRRVSDWVRRSQADLQPDPSLSLTSDYLTSDLPRIEQTDPANPALRSRPPPYPNASSTMRTDRSGFGDTLDYGTLPPRRAASLRLSLSPARGTVFDGVSRSSTLGRRGPPLDPRYGPKRPVWSKVPLLFQLTKTAEGFGFSLSEYEELTVSDTEANTKRRSLTLGLLGSTNPKSSRVRRSATMPPSPRTSRIRGKKRHGILLVDSVVPGSVAHQDGRIAVGDRLLFVNDRNLSRASLREAAAALRAAPRGPCLLGIAKMHLEPNVLLEPAVDGPTGYTPPALYDDLSRTSRTLERPLHVNTGLDVADAGPDPYTLGDFQTLNFHVLPYPDPHAHLHDPNVNVPPVQRSEERSTQIHLDSAPLGIKLDALAAAGQDGCRVVQLLEGGAVFRTNALGMNDYITEMNGRDMRGITNLEAFNILRDLSSAGQDVNIRYIPASVIEAHRLFHLHQAGLLLPAMAPLAPSENFVDGTYPPVGNHVDAAPVKWWTKAEKVILRRQPHENAWGLELTENLPEALRQKTPSPELEHPTWVAQILPNTPADRCGSLRIGDLILRVEDRDVSNLGSVETTKLMRHYLDANASELCLGVRYSTSDIPQPPESLVSEVNRTLVVAEVERRRSSSSVVLQPSEARANHLTPDEVDEPRRVQQDLSPESSQMETPEPLTELDSRDELNVLTRAIPSPVQQNGAQTDSSDENGHRASSGDRPVVSVACPVIRDETVMSGSGGRVVPAPLDLVNGYANGIPSPPPPLPPRRFSSEAKIPVEFDSDEHLPVVTEDPVFLYTRVHPPGDEIITVNLPLSNVGEPIENGGVNPKELVTTPCKVENLGLRLVGSRMPEKIATYIGGFCPGSIAALNDVLRVGDEIVQVGQISVVGLSRLTVRRCLARAIQNATSCQQSKSVETTDGTTSPVGIELVIRRNPAHSEMMASSNNSPEHRRDSFLSQLLSPPVVASRASVAGSAFVESDAQPVSQMREETAKDSSHPVSDLGFPRGPSPLHRYPVAANVVQQISATLNNESLHDLDVFDVELQRDKDGFGIFIVNLGPNDEPGVFVSELAPNGAAAMHGELRTHDRILAVNGVVPQDYDATLQLMKHSDSQVRLTVGRAKLSDLPPIKPTPPVATSSPAPPDSGRTRELPLKQPIIPGVKTLIELKREPGNTFGFSVVGGKDTMLGVILIHEVHANGVAAVDGRLCPGDRLLAVNGVSLLEADHSNALKAIRLAGDCLQLLVYRDPAPHFIDEDDVQQVTAKLTRKPGQNLGISLVSRAPYSTGTAIGQVLKDSLADQAGLLQAGDVLVEVNGRDVRLAQTQEVASLLREPIDPVVIKVERLPSSRRPPYPPALPRCRLHVYTVLLQRASPSASQLSVVGESGKLPPIGFVSPLLEPSNTDASFGLCIREATVDELLDAGGRLIVADIQSGSPAALSAMILPGDRLLSVDREPVDWLHPNEVLTLFAGLKQCTLELGRINVAPYPLVEIDGVQSSASPPYPPPSQELPELFGGVMPFIEPPCGLHEMDTVEEEEDPGTDVKKRISPIIDANSVAKVNQIDDEEGSVVHGSIAASDVSSISVGIADERGPGGFQVRQIELPIAPQPPRTNDGSGICSKWSEVDPSKRPVLGLRLAKGSGISGPVVIRVRPNSVAAKSGIRVGDRILGLDETLLLAVASNRSPSELVAMIEERWLAHSTGAEQKPVSLTVISVPVTAEMPANHMANEVAMQNGIKSERSNSNSPSPLADDKTCSNNVTPPSEQHAPKKDSFDPEHPVPLANDPPLEKEPIIPDTNPESVASLQDPV